ncbi:amino acid--tRNA ligase-related protein [Spirochaeta thermophila]|nr:amino acid--tRNA ligase-related protein [Spirochaeta thermophila]
MRSLHIARIRARLLSELRAFFRAHDHLEVDTPHLAPYLIPEAHIRPFTTTHHPLHGTPRTLSLLPSPELWMKHLLAQGYGDIFQISHVFRDAEPPSPRHSPEFTMLEWYTTDSTADDQISLTEELFATLAHSLDAPHLSPPFHRLTMEEAFTRYAGFSLEAHHTLEALASHATRLGLDVSPHESAEDLFHRIFLTFVEPHLPVDRPLVLTHYPTLVPTLARPIPDTPWRERWELYAGGMELANCYTEETDPDRVEHFMEGELTRRGTPTPPPPPDFPATCTRIPHPTSGVALGVDRLLMYITGEKDIRGVIFFPLSDNIEAIVD